MQTENSIKPNKFEISKHQNGKCTVLFYDNIITVLFSEIITADITHLTWFYCPHFYPE